MPDAALPPWLGTGTDFVTIKVIARPGAARRGVLRVDARGLVIGVASPAEHGKANEELIATIAEIAGVARRQVSILRGGATRNKVVRIATAQPSTIAGRFAAEAK